MTLRELLEVTPEAAYVGRVPSVLAIAESEARIITRVDMDAETNATVYDNGYVVFQREERATVFPLADCREYAYRDANGVKSVVPFEEFASQPWQIRVFMEGDKRLAHNGYNRGGATTPYDAIGEDSRMLSDQGLGDALRMLIEEETIAEEMEELHRLLNKITPKQRFVLIECVVNGRMHADVAAEMGTSRQAVTDCLKKTLCRMRRDFGKCCMTGK